MRKKKEKTIAKEEKRITNSSKVERPAR